MHSKHAAMKNENKQKYPKVHKRRKNRSALTGVGLILFGGVLFLLLLGNGKAATLPSAGDLSIIPAEVNFPAPQLSLESINGEVQSLEDFKGSIVLVNNWATWCPPCKAEMPILKQYHDTHTKEGFTVIAVEAGDGKDTVTEFANLLSLTFPVWLDPESASINAIRNGSLPNSYVIDRTGTVRYSWTGEVTMSMLEKYITPLITENN